MSSRTGELFEKPRRPRRVLMHVTDAGFNCSGPDHLAKFKCRLCEHESEWMPISNVTEAKRGIPCPECNKPAEAQELWDAMHHRLKA